MHLNSKKHRIASYPCFGAPRCDRMFISVSDAILHIENGRCESGLTGVTLRRAVVRVDRNNVITNPARMIGYNGGTVTQQIATERARNQSGFYECALCHNEYTSLRALNSHYNSNAHAEKVFRCPNRQGCRKEFGTLSGVIQHIEDGYCGARGSQHVQENVSDLMRDMGRMRLTY